MMFFVDMTNVITLFLVTVLTALLIFLSQEEKKSFISALSLIGFLGLLIMHVIQRITLAEPFMYLSNRISISIALDFVFIFISFFAYLWVDDIEAKKTGKKSLNNSLDWFWKNV